MRLACLAFSILAACGRVTGGSDPDGGGNADANLGADADLTGDAGVPDAAVPGRVDVTVKKNGVVQEQLWVLFSDAAGTGVALIKTDINGHTNADLYPGGIVSIFWTDAEGKHVASFYDMRPGDHVVYDLDPSPPPTANVGNAIIDFTPIPATTATFDIDLGCTSLSDIPVGNLDDGDLYTTPIDSDCVGSGGKVSAVVKAKNGSGTVLGFGIATDALQDTGNWALPLTWQTTGLPEQGLSMTNAPQHSTVFLAEMTLSRNGIRHQVGSIPNVAAGQGASHSVTWPYPSGFAQSIHLQMGVAWDLSAGPEGFSIYNYGGATVPSNPFTRDLSTTVLPRVNNVTTSLADATRPAVSWMADGALAADVFNVWLHQDGPTVADSDDQEYRLFLPPDYPPPVKLPIFPTDVDGYTPLVGSAFDPPRLTIFDIGSASGYRDGQVLFGTVLADPTGANAQEMRFEFVGDK